MLTDLQKRLAAGFMLSVTPLVALPRPRRDDLDEPHSHVELPESPQAVGGFAIEYQSTASAYTPTFISGNAGKPALPGDPDFFTMS